MLQSSNQRTVGAIAAVTVLRERCAARIKSLARLSVLPLTGVANGCRALESSRLLVPRSSAEILTLPDSRDWMQITRRGLSNTILVVLAAGFDNPLLLLKKSLPFSKLLLKRATEKQASPLTGQGQMNGECGCACL